MDAKGRGYMEGLPFRGLAIFVQTVKDVYMTKGVLLALFFLMIPPLISAYTLANAQEGFKEWWNLFAVFGLVLYLQLLVLLYSLVYGSSMINENIDNRTMTYLTIRTAKRFEVVIWKYIGLVISLQLMFTFSIIVTYIILGSKPVTYNDIRLRKHIRMYRGRTLGCKNKGKPRLPTLLQPLVEKNIRSQGLSL